MKNFGFGLLSRIYWARSICSLAILCCTQVAIGAEQRDTDRDGWFDGKANRRISLRLVGVESEKAGDFYLKIDEVQFPHTKKGDGAFLPLKAGAEQKLDWIAAQRAIGTWFSDAKESELTWKTKVTVFWRDSNIQDPAKLQWLSGEGTITWRSR